MSLNLTDIKQYEYRRQFIAGRDFWGENKYWKHINIGKNIKLSVHRDLPILSTERDNGQLFLLGYILDPQEPDRMDIDIIEWLFKKSTDMTTLIENTYRLTGRWILIYVENEQVTFFHDPFGMRKIYYANIEGNIWCGSEPAILADCLDLKPGKKNQEKQKFINSKTFKDKESFWVGDKTRYHNIWHLLPNHSLNFTEGTVQRYWINQESTLPVVEAAKQAGDILEGSLLSAQKRFKLMMPITAGWDSRVLFAASQKIKDDIFYFISTKNQLTKKDDDIQIPQNLFKKLDLSFHILDNLKSPDDDFLNTLKKNVDLNRNLPKTLTFYEFYLNHQEKVNINGRGAETARSYYPYEKNPTAEFLAKVTGYEGYKFVIKEIKNWLKEVQPVISENSIDVMDLYYWEQRMGNWGGTDPVEQDIAIEEFCPFNNRKLMMILLNTKRKYRIRPDYRLQKKIINYLWSELFEEPINPTSKKTYFKKLFMSKIPPQLKNSIKKGLSMFPYDS